VQQLDRQINKTRLRIERGQTDDADLHVKLQQLLAKRAKALEPVVIRGQLEVSKRPRPSRPRPKRLRR